MTRTISLRKLFEICFVVLFSLPLVAHAELTRPAIFLYQTSDVLTNRTTANELAEFIRLVQSKLILENFSRADGDYAVVIAVHPSRQILGWACVKSGQRLEEAQNEVNRLTRSIDAPSVTNGSIVFALVYSATTDSAQSPWLPIPAEWTGIIESSGKPMEIDPILEELFENIAS